MAKPARQPLILISQASRSGGTLLSQLFDHHPQLWAHPHELKIGRPKKWHWPDITSSRPGKVFDTLCEPIFTERFGRSGLYQKGSETVLPVYFDGRLQRKIFCDLAKRHPPQRRRDWLDLYFTSFFLGWLDHQSRYGEKRYITAFASLLSMKQDSMERFRIDYPDGWLISILRDPLSWYASIKKRTQDHPALVDSIVVDGRRQYGSFEASEEFYLFSIEAMHRNARLFGDRFIALDYRTLASETEPVMRGLAARLGLAWDDILTSQTFNGMPIAPNTSFGNPRDRQTVLSVSEIDRIKNGPLMEAYRGATRLCDPAAADCEPSAAAHA